MTLPQLIALIEAGATPLRELDALIHQWRIGGEITRHGDGTPWRIKLGESFHAIPRYTTSLDAASSLMPEGWRVTVIQEVSGLWRVHAFPPKPPYPNIDVFNGPDEKQARVLAALKVRAA